MIPKSSGLETLARCVGRRNRASIARQVMKNKRMKVLHLLGNYYVQKEMSSMCSKNSSVLRGNQMQQLKEFSWEKLDNEMRNVAPTLYLTLKGMVEVKRRNRFSKSTKKRGSYRPSDTDFGNVCSYNIATAQEYAHESKQVIACAFIVQIV